MINRSLFNFPREIRIEAFDPSSLTNISLCLHSDNHYGYLFSQEQFSFPPEISGFPRDLCALNGFVVSSPEISTEEAAKEPEGLPETAPRSIRIMSLDSELDMRLKKLRIPGIACRARSVILHREDEPQISFKDKTAGLEEAIDASYPVGLSELAGDSYFVESRTGQHTFVEGDDGNLDRNGDA